MKCHSEYKKPFIVDNINHYVNYLLSTKKPTEDRFKLFEDMLRADIDLRLGINSKLITDKNAPTSLTWLRDASDAIPLDQRIPNDHPLIEANNTLLRCLSRMRAIEDALQKNKNATDDNLRSNFAKLTYSILTATKNATPQTLADTNEAIELLETEFNNYLIKTLHGAGLAEGCETKKDYEALLFHYRILASVLDPAKSLVTIIEDKKNGVRHETIQHPVTRKTDKQKLSLKEMNTLKKDEKNYHTAQKPAIQKSNNLFHERIAADNTQLSAQARKEFLEEVKNGWIVTKTVTFPDGSTETTSYVRCGSPVFVGKGETQERLEEHAQENIRQIQQTAYDHKIKFSTTHLICLLTNSRNESQKTVVETLKSIVDGCDVHLIRSLPNDLKPYQNSCILVNNQLHYITPETQSVIINIKDLKKLKDGINSSLEKNANKVHLSSIDVKTLIIKNGGKQLEQLRPVQMSRIPVNFQGAATETVKLAKLIRNYIKTYNSELDLSCHAGKAKRYNLATRIMEIASELAANTEDNVLNILFCNSGQDRTGTVALLFEILWTMRMYQKHGITFKRKDLETLIMQGANTEEMATHAAPGSRGTKSDSSTKDGTDKKGALSEESEKQLRTKSAKTNKKNTVSRLPDNPTPAYFRADFTKNDLKIVLSKNPIDIVLTGIRNYAAYKNKQLSNQDTAGKTRALQYQTLLGIQPSNSFDKNIVDIVNSSPKQPDPLNLTKAYQDANNLSELQKYVVILALLSSTEGKVLKNTVLTEYDLQNIGSENLQEKLEKEICARTGINKNLLDVLVKKLAIAINSQDKKQIDGVMAVNKSALVDLYAKKNVEEQEKFFTSPMPAKKAVSQEKIQTENTTHEEKILNFLKKNAKYLGKFQKDHKKAFTDVKAFHSTLAEIIKIACEVPPTGNEYDVAKFKSDQFARIKALCKSNTEGFKNWYGKSHISVFSEGRHPVVDIIYHAVLNPDSIYTRIIDNLKKIINNRGTLESELGKRDTLLNSEKSELKIVLSNYYKNIKYLAAKNPKHNLEIKTLDELCALDKQRIAIKKIDADINRLTSKWKDGDENATMKLVAYEKLKVQILESGIKGLKFDTRLENFAWRSNQKVVQIDQKEPQPVVEKQKPTIAEALGWSRHGFFHHGEPKSMETFRDLVALKPRKVS